MGSYLAERLAGKGNKVTVIEKNEEICWQLASSVDAVVIHGDACNLDYQDEAQVDRADVFAAVTGDDDDNLVACQLARISFGVPRLVARVNNPKNEPIFSAMGIDAVSSTFIIAGLIESLATVEDIVTLHTLHKGRLAVVELDIPKEGSDACSCTVDELQLPKGSVLISLLRGDEVIIPHGGDRIHPGDQVIAVTFTDREEQLRRALLGSAGQGNDLPGDAARKEGERGLGS